MTDEGLDIWRIPYAGYHVTEITNWFHINLIFRYDVKLSGDMPDIYRRDKGFPKPITE